MICTRYPVILFDSIREPAVVVCFENNIFQNGSFCHLVVDDVIIAIVFSVWSVVWTTQRKNAVASCLENSIYPDQHDQVSSDSSHITPQFTNCHYNIQHGHWRNTLCYNGVCSNAGKRKNYCVTLRLPSICCCRLYLHDLYNL